MEGPRERSRGYEKLRKDEDHRPMSTSTTKTSLKTRNQYLCWIREILTMMKNNTRTNRISTMTTTAITSTRIRRIVILPIIIYIWGTILYSTPKRWTRSFQTSNRELSRLRRPTMMMTTTKTYAVPDPGPDDEPISETSWRLPPIIDPHSATLMQYGTSDLSSKRTTGKNIHTTTTTTNINTTTRFLIFRPPLEEAQGVGNILNGLLAAHFLGQEFSRIVCISQDWEDWIMAWEALTPECSNLLHHPTTRSHESTLLPPRTSSNSIWLLNYAIHKTPLNECEMKRRLEGPETFIYFVANDYPRWPTPPETTTTTTTTRRRPLLGSSRMEVEGRLASPSTTSDNIPYPIIQWTDYYRPTHALLEMLPWTTSTMKDASTTTSTTEKRVDPPTTVVHLREPDNDHDIRRGLDVITRQAMGETLPKNTTYLVTNRVDYYSWFQTQYGWNHPPWTGVRHSALPLIEWSSKTNSESANQGHNDKIPPPRTTTHTEEWLQLWADWWTMYQATTLYHTHSDFSRSAARWSHKDDHSYTIQGADNQSGTLILQVKRDHLWGVEDTKDANGVTTVVLPLSERNREMLHNCDPMNGVGHVLDLDDHIHDDENGKQGYKT